MKVSIIIPIYNVEAYLDACLQSVLNQIYRNFELILVDDDSTDGSMEIAYKFIEENQSKCGFDIHLIKQPCNKGVSVARNTGIEASTGDYLYFLDSDDEITPDCIATLVEPLERYPYDMVIGDFDINKNLPNKWRLYISEGEWKPNQKIFHEYCYQQIFVMPWNKLCRREFIMENKLFFEPDIRNEDALWSFLIALHIESLFIIKKKTYHYMIRPTSYAWKMDIPNEIRNYITIIALMLKKLDNSKNYQKNDLYHLFDDILQSRYIGSITHKMEKEYRTFRKYDIRPYLYVLKNCFNSVEYLRHHGHRLLPTYIAYRLYGYISEHL